MSNSINFVGHCSSDAKVRTIANGNQVLEVSVANNVGYGDKQVTNWIRVSYWTKNADKLLEYFTKGQSVFVSGELSTNEYFAQDGNKRFQLLVKATILELVGKKSSDTDSNVKTYNPPETSSNYDDDMPF
jgi:single-strand DNA-binding protein